MLFANVHIQGIFLHFCATQLLLVWLLSEANGWSIHCVAIFNPDLSFMQRCWLGCVLRYWISFVKIEGQWTRLQYIFLLRLLVVAVLLNDGYSIARGFTWLALYHCCGILNCQVGIFLQNRIINLDSWQHWRCMWVDSSSRVVLCNLYFNSSLLPLKQLVHCLYSFE